MLTFSGLGKKRRKEALAKHYWLSTWRPCLCSSQSPVLSNVNHPQSLRSVLIGVSHQLKETPLLTVTGPGVDMALNWPYHMECIVHVWECTLHVVGSGQQNQVAKHPDWKGKPHGTEKIRWSWGEKSSGNQPHQVVYESLCSPLACTCIDMALNRLPKTMRTEVWDRPPCWSHTGHWMAHTGHRSQ